VNNKKISNHKPMFPSALSKESCLLPEIIAHLPGCHQEFPHKIINWNKFKKEEEERKNIRTFDHKKGQND